MRELRERARLLDEHPSGLAIGGGRGIEDLDRDLAVEGGVLGEVDLRRASGPDRLDDPVAALQNALESQFRSPPRRADYTARSVGYYVRKRVCHRPPPPHSPATTRTPTQARPLLVPMARRRLPLRAAASIPHAGGAPSSPNGYPSTRNAGRCSPGVPAERGGGPV